MERTRIVLVICLLMVCSVSAWAARPFSTDDAGTVAPEKFELEMGYDFGDIAGIGQGSLRLGFKHGLTRKMDIGVGFSHTFVPIQPEGLSQAEISLKFAVLPELLAVSFAGGPGSSSYALNSAFTRTFGPVELDLNLGYGATGDPAQPGFISYGIALIWCLEKFDIGCEVSGDKDGVQSCLAGGRYRILEGLAMDIGYTQDRTGQTKVGTAGLHYEF